MFRCSKIPKDLEDPIDEKIYNRVGPQIIPHFRKLGMTPNQITFISFILGILSVYSLYHDKIILSIGLFMLSYIFDCFDGCMARQYNMSSPFGDIFDHISDFIVNILLYAVIFYKLLRKDIFVSLTVILVTGYLSYKSIVYATCINNYNNTLNKTQSDYLCPYSNNQKTELERYMKNHKFGSGIFTLIYIPFLILLLKLL